MTDAGKEVSPLLFGRHPDEILVSLKIEIRIPDHFWLRHSKFKGSDALGVGGGAHSLSALLLALCRCSSQNLSLR